MTNEEAIKEIRKFERCHYELPNGDADLKVYKALSMALEALKKQIPKKPIDDGWLYCECGQAVLMECTSAGKRWKYCPICGQRILWEDD